MIKPIGMDAAIQCLGWLCNKMSTRYGVLWDKRLQNKGMAVTMRMTWLEVLARMPRGHIIVAMQWLHCADEKKHKDYPPSAYQFEVLPLAFAINELPPIIDIYKMICRGDYQYEAVRETAVKIGRDQLKTWGYDKSLRLLREVYEQVMSDRVKNMEIGLATMTLIPHPPQTIKLKEAVNTETVKAYSQAEIAQAKEDLKNLSKKLKIGG